MPESRELPESLLLIDDDEQVSAMISALLQLEGYTVEVHNDAASGLEAGLSHSFDLVLLDLNLPEFDGFEVLSRLRSRWSMSQLPVVMMTGDAESKTVVEALNRQANGYVTKPVDSRALLHRVRQVLAFKREELARRAQQEPTHDLLTGLPTRTVFLEHLHRSLARARRRSDYLFAVVSLSPDRYNIINDSLGHHVGEQLLRSLARRLQEMLRTGDEVARFDNHEFTILLDDVGALTDVTAVAARILEHLAQPITIHGREVVTTVSIGIALGHESSDGVEPLLRDAHTAMLTARNIGGGRIETFESTMHTRAARRLQLEADLRRALDRQEFVLHYQPIYDTITHQIFGFEALVRWMRADGEIVLPAEFIPLAEESGFIVPLGMWIAREACRQARVWQERFPDAPPMVSINLSGKQFLQPDLYTQLCAVLAETRVAPKFIEFEITESTMMHNAEVAADVLSRLKDRNLHLAIDDFGIGYSSLSYLHRFPFDTLKVDKSFVARLEEDREAVKIVQTIILLARNLGLRVIAEGVETEKQLELLRDLECEMVQGFYFASALPVDAADALLAGAGAQLISPES